MKSKNVDGSRFRLRDDEYLLWTGQPSQGLQFSVNDWFLIPAALIWSTLFAYASYVSILRADGSESLLWQVPSFVLATYILFWRFAVDTSIRAKTFYGITNQRVLFIVPTLFSTRRLSIELDATIPKIELSGHRTGSIIFGEAERRFCIPTDLMAGREKRAPAFQRIDNVETANRIIAIAQANLGQTIAPKLTPPENPDGAKNFVRDQFVVPFWALTTIGLMMICAGQFPITSIGISLLWFFHLAKWAAMWPSVY